MEEEVGGRGGRPVNEEFEVVEEEGVGSCCGWDWDRDCEEEFDKEVDTVRVSN